MKFKHLLPLTLAFAAATATAEQYTSLSSAEYADIDTPFGSADTFSIGSTYYFSPKQSLGPLKEFEYINHASNVFGGFVSTDSEFGDFDSTVIGGEYFTGALKFGGAFENSDFSDVFRVSAGYFVDPNLLLEVEAVSVEDGDNSFFFSGQYNHQLVGNDYVGVTVSVDDELDNSTLSARYFTELTGGRYFAAGIALLDTEFGNDAVLEADYYFNQHTGVSASLNDEGGFGLGVSHFFNRNIAGELAFSSDDQDGVDVDVLTLGLVVQL